MAFWREKSLQEMTATEWESLCDGCGRCCLNKLEDWDTGEIHWTNTACELLNLRTCRCKDYENRFETVPDCIQLTLEKVRTLTWLPPTCAYRLLDEGKDLEPWHPLISGDPQSVEKAGISVRGRVVSEVGITPEEFEEYLVTWPGERPENEAD